MLQSRRVYSCRCPWGVFVCLTAAGALCPPSNADTPKVDFSARLTYSARFVTGLATGDFNGDGLADVATIELPQPPVDPGTFVVISVRLQGANGRFLAPVYYPLLYYPLRIAAQFLITGDFNRDGRLDLVAADPDRGLAVFLGAGNGTFSSRSTLSTPYFVGITAGDVNHDGALDLALLVSANFELAIRILPGDGSGDFGTPVTTTVSSNLLWSIGRDFGLVDMNGDGNPDVVFARRDDYTGAHTTFLFGNGDFTFGTPVDYPGAAVPAGLIPADVNGDGKLT